MLYFDSWSQLDTPYISATYATKQVGGDPFRNGACWAYVQDRGSVLLGDSTDRSWEGFSVGVKLSNPEPRSNAGDWVTQAPSQSLSILIAGRVVRATQRTARRVTKHMANLIGSTSHLIVAYSS